MKHLIFRLKQILSLSAFISLLILIHLEYKTVRLERKLERVTVNSIDTIIYVPPKPTIVKP